MLELRPTCENCNKPLPPDAVDARVCTFECTFCEDCVETILENVCPNCGGGFEQRPIRPKALLEKYPATKKVVYRCICSVRVPKKILNDGQNEALQKLHI